MIWKMKIYLAGLREREPGLRMHWRKGRRGKMERRRSRGKCWFIGESYNTFYLGLKWDEEEKEREVYFMTKGGRGMKCSWS